MPEQYTLKIYGTKGSINYYRVRTNFKNADNHSLIKDMLFFKELPLKIKQLYRNQFSVPLKKFLADRAICNLCEY